LKTRKNGKIGQENPKTLLILKGKKQKFLELTITRKNNLQEKKKKKNLNLLLEFEK
jgi:hypothetical protein